MGITFCMSRLFMHYRDISTDPAVTSMGEMLCGALLQVMESTDDLVDILGCPYEKITLPMLGVAFFERGLLARRVFGIRPTGTIALGDVGYQTAAGNFVVVDNVHENLQAIYGSLSWDEDLQVTSGTEYLWPTSREIVESQAGTCYQRRRQARFPRCLRPL